MLAHRVGCELKRRHLSWRDARALPMHWFSKGDQKEFFWEGLKEPLGDLEAAKAIRAICRSASPDVGKPNGFSGLRNQGNDERKSEFQVRAAKAAMEIALKISDQLVRDAALRQIV